MEAMIETMKRANLNAGSPQTYARGIRATALALFDRPQDRAVLKDDVAYLLKTHKQGAYTYNSILDEQSGNVTRAQWISLQGRLGQFQQPVWLARRLGGGGHGPRLGAQDLLVIR